MTRIPTTRILSAGLRAYRQHGATIAAAAALGAERRPHDPVLIDADGQISGQELIQSAQRLAARWSASGLISAGEPLGLLCGNHRRFVTALIAGSLIGADIVLLSTYSPPRELVDVLNDHQVRTVVTDATRPGTPEFEAWPGIWEPIADTGLPAPGPLLPPPRPPRPGQLVLLTSGTGGRPRGAARDSYGWAQVLPAMHLIRRLGLRAGEPMMVLPPLFHGFGLGFLIVGLLTGTPVVLADRPDPHQVITRLQRDQVRTLVAVPPTLARLVPVAGELSTPLRAIVTGSSALHARTSNAIMEAFGPILFNLYGCTEAGWATLAGPADLMKAPGSVGCAVPGVRLKIVDGEIVVASPLATRSASGRWRPTGDLGHRDDHGLLFLTGRRDDLVVIGGENIHPARVEAALLDHPAVAEATIDPVEDEVYGSRLHARIVIRSGAVVTDDELRSFVATRVPRFAVPDRMLRVPVIPRGPSGKAVRTSAGSPGSSS